MILINLFRYTYLNKFIFLYEIVKYAKILNKHNEDTIHIKSTKCFTLYVILREERPKDLCTRFFAMAKNDTGDVNY